MDSGTISVYLVNIPAKLCAALESAAQISFHQLHDKCSSRIKQQPWCFVDEKLVPGDHLVKGYEFARDQYVLVAAEGRARPVGDRTVLRIPRVEATPCRAAMAELRSRALQPG